MIHSVLYLFGLFSRISNTPPVMAWFGLSVNRPPPSILNIKVTECKRRIIQSGLKIPIKYLEEIENFKDGNVYWSKIAMRYKD